MIRCPSGDWWCLWRFVVSLVIGSVSHLWCLESLAVSIVIQALHGLAPKCKLINMHELIYKSTNDYVTLLPCENGSNVNNKA